ncbi:hypothetical protein [Klebsiella pasteurii]|uniref:hypothetical protein n=1 Tax=Klebsiella pasteurii TaxID=2587529 RepID=UPI00237B54F1|nr:hypothetical protein [Klebsiella pasteurii]ELT9705705.1 hypothetical protein [Klebsiella michiganensis]MDD9666156.1 hypothetical protein [Klebsiella pasteurii]MDD9671763.1 hypothetical protein [Klebsiella pasteurii]MDD9687822.1 hypothetical protein [Klebsiella pasteurii]
MAKIRYLQRTHDSIPGDVKAVDDRCAKVLVLLDKAEYCTVVRTDGRKNKRKAENG